MDLKFHLENVNLKVPLNKDEHLRLCEKEYKVYLIIELDGFFSNDRQKVIIPLTLLTKEQKAQIETRGMFRLKAKDFCKEGEYTETFEYTQSIKETVVVGTFMSSIEAGLQIPFVEDKHNASSMRFSKAVVAPIYEIMDNKKRYPVKMHTQLDEGEVLCTFDFCIDDINRLPEREFDSRFRNRQWYANERRRLIQMHHDHLEAYRANAHRTSKWYLHTFKGESEYFINSARNFNGKRLVHTYLKWQKQISNEAYWESQLDLLLALEKCRLGLPVGNTPSDKKVSKCLLDKSYTKTKWMALAANLLRLGSLSMPYMTDSVLHPDGRIEQSPRCDIWNTNSHEGGDDCDGLNLDPLYRYEQFISNGPYKNEILERLRKMCLCYDPQYVFSVINTASSRDPVQPTPHATAILVLKQYFLDHVAFPDDLDMEELQETKKKFEEFKREEMEKLKEYFEEDMPPVVFLETTCWMHPYPDFIDKPLQRSDKLPRIHKVWGPSDGLFDATITQDEIQTKTDCTLLRFYTCWTKWFVEHPTYPLNLPSFTFSTQYHEGRFTKFRGVDVNEFMARAFHEKRHKHRNIFVPHSRFDEFEMTMAICEFISRDKFAFNPLALDNNGEIVSRHREIIGLEIERPNHIDRHTLYDMEENKLTNLYPSADKDIPKNCYAEVCRSDQVVEVLKNIDKKHFLGCVKFPITAVSTLFVVFIRSQEYVTK